MWPEIIPFHAAFAMKALSRRFVNAATFPFIYHWNCLGLLCCPSFVNCSLVKYVREHWTTYSMSCKYVKWTSLFLFNRSTFFDNKKSSKLVKDVDCLSDWEVSNGGESEGRVKEKGQRIITICINNRNMSPPPPPPSTTRTKIDKKLQLTLNSLRSYMKTLGSQRLLTKSRSIASQFGLSRRVGVVKQPTKGWQWQSCKLRWNDLQVWKSGL